MLAQVLVGAAEQLAQQALLHVLHFPDGRRQRLRELVVQAVVLCHLPELSVLALHVCVRVRGRHEGRRELRRWVRRRGLRGHAALVRLADVQHVDVGRVHCAGGALPVADTRWDGAEHAGDLHAVTRARHVHQLRVCDKCDGVGCLALQEQIHAPMR